MIARLRNITQFKKNEEWKSLDNLKMTLLLTLLNLSKKN